MIIHLLEVTCLSAVIRLTKNLRGESRLKAEDDEGFPPQQRKESYMLGTEELLLLGRSAVEVSRVPKAGPDYMTASAPSAE